MSGGKNREIIEDLRRRLATAEAAASASRENEERYRTFFHGMGQGYTELELVRGEDGQVVDQRYISLNPAFERLFGVAVTDAVGRTAGEVFPNLEAWWHEAFDRIARHGQPERIENIMSSLGRAFEIFAYPAGGDRLTVLYEDVTDRRRIQDALRESETRYRSLVEGFGQATWEAEPDGRIVSDSPSWRAYTGQPLDEWLGSGWLTAIHPDDRTPTLTKWLEAVEARHAVDHEYRLWHAPSASWRWSNVRAVPILDTVGAIQRWVGINIDVNDRRMLQESQQVMVSELQHRTRNLISVVRAIAGQTIRASITLTEFEAAFNNRLNALSRVQGLLSRSDDKPITIGALLRSELEALGAADRSDRLVVRGPEVRLRKGAVQTLALALHELCTNARKYGALTRESGRLRITWRTYSVKGEGLRLILEWVETGLIREPENQNQLTRQDGYGRQLIERGLPYALNARTSFELGATELRCTIDLPLPKRGARNGQLGF
ncbi:protein of unknown function [Methylorubrum extorquens]|uniref:Blue-light-activated histidine kinase n=1 Tax=Methylorubrum extorquens TaxID=408 RepID=A0A2N9AN50_METEX|nr:protein of unknown function [Methylorubrum extorquens]